MADAALRGGLPLRDAETALFALAGEYRGHIAATSKGEIVFSFPRGLRRPVERAGGWWARPLRAIGRALAAAGRFVIRAWVSAMVVVYALILGGVLIALAAKSEDGIGDAAAVVLRIIAEALFWTFHPLSPVLMEREPAWMRIRGRRRRADTIPFYEKVNQFVFGPARRGPDPGEPERTVLSEIRRLQGRVGPGDVMRVTGASREEAEALLCRLVVDYDGDIQVTDGGAMVYRFAALRLTAHTRSDEPRAVAPIWTKAVTAPPLTGNPSSSNWLFGALNGFNLATSGYVLANGLTFERIGQLLSARLADDPATATAAAMADVSSGTPLVLGAIPFVFSAALFALPLARWLRQPARVRKAARENARRALLRSVLERLSRPASPATTATEVAIEARTLSDVWRQATGRAPDEAELTGAVRSWGGEPDVDEQGLLVYRFADLAREARALQTDRRLAPIGERDAGDVIFSSKD